MHHLLRKKRRQLRSGWNKFWHAKKDPSLVGLLRIATGLMLMYTHAVWSLQLHDFFGSHSWMRPDLVQEIQVDQYQFSYLWLISDPWLGTAHAIAFVILTAFTCGFLTRLTSLLSVAILVSYARRQPAATFGLDQINSFLTLYLAYGYLLTPVVQRAFSVDRLLFLRRSDRSGRLENSEGANITLRLMQIQMCVVYFFAGLSKLQGEAWWTGEAIWLALANEEYANSFSMLWTWRYPVTLAALAHLTVFWELSFGALIWNKHLRPIYLAVGLLMHLGIGAFLSMWTFGIVMIVGCSSFLCTEWVASLLRPRQDSTSTSESNQFDSGEEHRETVTQFPPGEAAEELLSGGISSVAVGTVAHAKNRTKTVSGRAAHKASTKQNSTTRKFRPRKPK